MQIAKEMQEHAVKQGNKWGIYNGLHVAAYAHEQMQNREEAIKGFKKAVNYLHEYLPNESAASSLIELSRSLICEATWRALSNTLSRPSVSLS